MMSEKMEKTSVCCAEETCCCSCAKTEPSDLQLFWRYTKLVVGSTGHLRAARFLLRALMHCRTTIDWLTFIDSRTYLSQAPEEVRRVLADKIFRPFARRSLSVPQRVKLLIDHYQSLEDILPADFILGMVSGKRYPLLEIQGRNEDEKFVVTMSREMLSQHQGEIALLFTDVVTQVPLARLVINIMRDAQGRKQFVFNGMQGPGPTYKSDIVRVTRHLDGLRPKRAVLEVGCALARWMGIEQVVAISKNNHVSQTKQKWRNRVRADYDTFWQEFSPKTLPNGDYEMPLVLPRRNIEDVTPKKRKEWLRRCARIDFIASSVSNAMSHYVKI